ncbi:MAG: twin-arginine translocation signal domain-containing protein [Chloroflexota bacterium]
MADNETLSTLSRRSFLKVAAAIGAAAAASGGGLAPAFAARKSDKKDTMDTPAITCGESTQVSIEIQVCAGESGAPAGFSIQWMTLADFIAGGNVWNDSDGSSLCAASFSGNANLSRYDLGPNECVTVKVGEFLFDNGASTNCACPLECGTEYVFRAFAHANSDLFRSEFTGNLTCSTLPCGCDEGCTLTQGYWKTHGPVPTGNNSNEWPVSSLELGTVTYTDVQLQSILDTSASGNGLIALAHQLIAAKLNVANGAADTDVAASIAAADALIGGLVVPPVGTGSLAPSATDGLVSALTDYNEGATGPGHCDDEEPISG